MVTEYLSQEHCDHPEAGCPLAALAPELGRTKGRLKRRFSAGMRAHKDMLVPFMPGGTAAKRERAFFVIFSTMIGAIEIVRMISDPDTREQILRNARNFLFDSFQGRRAQRTRLQRQVS